MPLMPGIIRSERIASKRSLQQLDRRPGVLEGGDLVVLEPPHQDLADQLLVIDDEEPWPAPRGGQDGGRGGNGQRAHGAFAGRRVRCRLPLLREGGRHGDTL
jgi:hypothetical protein